MSVPYLVVARAISSTARVTRDVDHEKVVGNLLPARSRPIMNHPPDVWITVRRDWALPNQGTLPQHFSWASNRTQTSLAGTTLAAQ